MLCQDMYFPIYSLRLSSALVFLFLFDFYILFCQAKELELLLVACKWEFILRLNFNIECMT